MISKWFELKPEAVALRKNGVSIRDIELSLGIPRSTLSGWLKDIKLTNLQKEILNNKHLNFLIGARTKAIEWHNKQKLNRLRAAEIEADHTLKKIKINNENIELALALLYLGEGFKKSIGTGMGNSDPLILKFFLEILINIYKLDINKIGFYLHLRYDQNPEKMKKYWSKELGVPICRFRKVSVDKRTINTKTYPDYKGVCLINCGNVAIQRKLVYIGRKFCNRVVENLRA